MTHPSGRKGKGFERELVNAARAEGLMAERAYGSNGRSLGLTEDVDLVVEGKSVQAKRRRAIAKIYRVPDSCYATVFREDRGETYVLLRWSDWLRLLGAGRDAVCPVCDDRGELVTALRNGDAVVRLCPECKGGSDE